MKTQLSKISDQKLPEQTSTKIKVRYSNVQLDIVKIIEDFLPAASKFPSNKN